MSPYRTPGAKGKPHPEYAMQITFFMTSGDHQHFTYEPYNNGFYSLEVHLRNTHELIVDKWAADPFKFRSKMREEVIYFKRDDKEFGVNLKHVESYSIEPYQLSERPTET